ncbi:hypothetical protein EON65_29915 [archaeon]|nr:MAG: hypothetical protein EON65_29915 [archaeon]
MRSSQFIMLTIFFLINSFWVNFYIGTFDTQIRDAGPLTDDEAHNYGRLFTLIITCGVVTIPIVGVLMDNYGFPLTSMVLIGMGVVWSVLLIMNTTTSIFVSFFFYSVYRTFFFTFVFAYLADTLGFKYFGVLAGVMFVLGGVLGILQYPIAEFASKMCVDNPLTHVPSCTTPYWLQVNMIMAVTILSTLAFSYHDYSRRRVDATKNTRIGRGVSSTSVNSTEITPLLRPAMSKRAGDGLGAYK